MVSVVFSTRKDNPTHIEHIKKTSGLGNKIEVIQYVNDGEFGLTELYNRALKETTNNILVYCHDDIILPDKWGKKMLNHFNESEYGILGVAGTTDLPETGMWWQDKTKMIGIVKHSHNGKTWESKYSASFGKEIIQSVVVDGLFFVVDKNRIKKDFNEDIKGFHLYEIDFTFNNHINGVKVGVVFDVRITHKSIGQTNQQWDDNRGQFVEIYKEHLPHNLKPEIRVENKKPGEEKKKSSGCCGGGDKKKKEAESYDKGYSKPGFCDCMCLANSCGGCFGACGCTCSKCCTKKERYVSGYGLADRY